MPSNKNYLPIVLLSASTIAAVAFAWHEYNEVKDLKGQLAETSSLNADWQKRLSALHDKQDALEKQLAEAKKKAAAAAEDRPRIDRLAGGRRAWGPGGPMDFMAALDDPKIAQLWTTQQKGMLDGRYAALFKSLKLTPEQLDKFKNLLVEKEGAMRDVLAAARNQGLDPRGDRDAFRQLVSQANSELDSNIKQVLGDSGFTQYQTYEQTLPQRNTVSQLQERLSYSGTPLSDAQSDQLLQAMVQSTPVRTDDSAGGRAFGFGNRGAPLNDQTIAQAASFLTPDQVAALQQMQTEQQAQRQMMQLMRQRSSGGAGGSAPSPAPGPKPTG